MKTFPHNPDQKVLIALLREVRLEKNMIQSEVADKLDRPQSFVAKYENSERRLDFIDVYYISQALEVPFGDLCNTFVNRVSSKRKNVNKP